MKRPRPNTAGDPAAFRDRWRRLAERALAHAADPACVTETDVEDVVNVTIRAENEWTRLTLDARGKVCRQLAQIHRDFVRQPRASWRAWLAPLLKLAAELVLELYAETDPGAEAQPAQAKADASAWTRRADAGHGDDR